MDPYRVLGVKPSDSDDEIKDVYRKLSRKYHPDSNINKSEEEQKFAEEKYKEINVAYDEIVERRKKGDYSSGSYGDFSGDYSNPYRSDNFGRYGSAGPQAGYDPFTDSFSYGAKSSYRGYRPFDDSQSEEEETAKRRFEQGGYTWGQSFGGFGSSKIFDMSFDFSGFDPKPYGNDGIQYKSAMNAIQAGQYDLAKMALAGVMNQRDGMFYYLNSIVCAGTGDGILGRQYASMAYNAEPENYMFWQLLKYYQRTEEERQNEDEYSYADMEAFRKAKGDFRVSFNNDNSASTMMTVMLILAVIFFIFILSLFRL